MEKDKLLKAWLSWKDELIGAMTSHDYIIGCSCSGCTLYRLIDRTEKALK